MSKLVRIGTRESQLAVWQATLVQQCLAANNTLAELEYIRSEGDIDLQTPLYEMGVQGIFTKTLDIALLSGKIDVAVHSMKDVPTQLPKGIAQAAVLERASFKDILVYKGQAINIYNQLGYQDGAWSNTNIPAAVNKIAAGIEDMPGVIGELPAFTVATSSIRRRAQWLHRYPSHNIENLRGNVNTRLQKVTDSAWNGAIFAAAGLERIGLRPYNAIDLDWMLPAPAQGAIMVVCREDDETTKAACAAFNHNETAICTKIERDFLRGLLGGCSTPISALAQVKEGKIHFRGNILSVNGQEKIEIEKTILLQEADHFGQIAATELLNTGGQKIADGIRNGA
jgi:hydroxymethylbilane synthase